MKTLDIKLFAMEYINLQDNLKYDDQMTMIDCVNDSDITEVKSFLFTGQMRSLEEGEAKYVDMLFEASNFSNMLETITESVLHETPAAIKALARHWAQHKAPDAMQMKFLGFTHVVKQGNTDELFKQHYEKALSALNKGVPIAGAVLVALTLLAARKAYKGYLTKAARACKGKGGIEKNECIRQFKVKGLEQEIAILRSSISSCKSVKNPAKCEAKIEKRVNAKKNAMQKVMLQKKPR